MDKKLEYLKKYNQKAKIIGIDEINNINSQIPEVWNKFIKENNIKNKIDILLGIWKEHSGTELRNTISYLYDHLENVEMLEIDGRYSILYTVKNSKGDTLYYEGRMPNEKFNNEKLEEVWNNIPFGVRSFYEKVHNGFYYYASESMGLVPLESVAYLDDFEWGILEEIEEPLQINLNSSFGFFSNGMGTYVVIDYMNCINDNATLWSAKKKPKYNINFWNVVDEWIVIGFEN